MPTVDDRLARYEGDPWERQPGESAKQHARFMTYASTPVVDRNLSELARQRGVTPSTIAEVAERFRWRERAALWEANELRLQHERDRKRRDAIADKELQLAERTINVALVAIAFLGRSMRKITENADAVLDPKDMPAWAKMVETLRKVAVDGPDQIVALTGPDGRGPVQIAEFDGLSPEQVKDRAGEMARSVLRLLHGGKAS